MYFPPQDVKCPKCGYETTYSQSETYLYPVINGKLVCPPCYRKFLLDSGLPLMDLKMGPPLPPEPEQPKPKFNSSGWHFGIPLKL